MNIKNVNKKVLAKAIGITMMGWIALPIIYYLLLKKEKKEGMKDKNETIPGEGREDSVHE